MAKNEPSGKSPERLVTALGLMSGTSMDGIDVALVRSDGETMLERGPAMSVEYEPDFRRRLGRVLEVAKTIVRRDERPGELGEIERELTERHARAVARFIKENGLDADGIDLIGFHGQTVLHRPEQGLTVQLGEGKLLAEATGIATVYDMRANDMAHGGQGAPLVPAYHRALAANLPDGMRDMPVAFVNIGGIANITWVGAGGKLIAFDTGPGNALIDQWVAAHAGVPYDPQGAIASEGRVVAALAKRYLANPYFGRKGPKSLDRNDFSPPEGREASLEDGARTLAHVTAQSIWKAGDLVPAPPKLWVICGGGRRNGAIMAELSQLAEAVRKSGKGAARVVTAEEAGFDGDAMEAEAWAYLAIRASKGLELTWPATTGCNKPVSGGVLARPE